MKSCLNNKITFTGLNGARSSFYYTVIGRPKNFTLRAFGYCCRNFSTSSSNLESSNLLPIPILSFINLDNKDCLKSYRTLLKDKGGIYSFKNTKNGNQYIGSAKDFYLRLNEHLWNKKSNLAIQNALSMG